MDKIDPKKLRRVPKEIAPMPAPKKTDGLAICLECWKDWMLCDDRDLSASRMKLAPGCDEESDEDHEGYDSDVHAEQRKDDMRIGEATNAIIQDLKPCWRWAIYKKCGVSTVWNFPKIDFMTCLIEAQNDLERQLRAHWVTSPKFY